MSPEIIAEKLPIIAQALGRAKATITRYEDAMEGGGEA